MGIANQGKDQGQVTKLGERAIPNSHSACWLRTKPGATRMVWFYMPVLISCKVFAQRKQTVYLAKQTLSRVLPLLLAFLVGEHWSLMLRHLITPQITVVYCPSSLLASKSCPMQVDSSKKCLNLIDRVMTLSENMCSRCSHLKYSC